MHNEMQAQVPVEEGVTNSSALQSQTQLETFKK